MSKKTYAITILPVITTLGLSLTVAITADAKSHKSSDTDIQDKIKIAKKDKKEDKKDTSSEKDSDKKDAKKDLKAEKSDKKNDKKEEQKNEKKEAKADDKKGGGGLFHLGGKKKEDGTPESGKSSDKPAGAVAEDPNKPKYKFDPALISVLKDINKSLKESEAVTKLEDPVQKLIAKLSGEALDKSLAAPELHANRIVEAKDKDRMEKSMSAESWESGSLDVSPDLKAAVVALWAKKIDGLLTVEIVGNYNGKAEGAEEPLGEFITVITARSTVDKGFDIQSQQDVSFWIGKVADLKIDYTSGKGGDKNVKSQLKLYVPITERKRQFMLALKEYEDKIAKAEEDKKKQAEFNASLAAQQKQVAEVLAKTLAESLAKQQAGGKPPGKPPEIASATTKEPATGGSAAEKKSEGSSDLKAAQQTSEAPAQTQATESPSLGVIAQNQTQVSSQAQTQNSNQAQTQVASIPPPAVPATPPRSTSILPEAHSSRSNWDSPAAPQAIRQPAPGSIVAYPSRAVAGQYLTVAVLGPQNNVEQNVGISFNGAQLSTGENGKVVYQVPEDAPPGYSLQIALSDRPSESSATIEVLQPLATPSSPQIPNLDSVSPVAGESGIVTIAGHNFDGIAERNRVIVDGAYDATVLVSSPVQIKAKLPGGIPAGPHTLCVSNAGLRSNPGNFDLVTVDLAPSGPDTPKNDLRKLMVKVQGTHNRVRVKLVNQSRDVIKLIKGDEVVVVTPGGLQNQVVVPVQRLRWGNYKIDAEVLI